MNISACGVVGSMMRGFSTSARIDINCHRTSIARIGRLTYTRMYPTTIVQCDGSTITIRYFEPRQIIKICSYTHYNILGNIPDLVPHSCSNQEYLVQFITNQEGIPPSYELPIDLTTLTEAERRKWIEARKPKVKVLIDDDIEDDFNIGNYQHLWEKK